MDRPQIENYTDIPSYMSDMLDYRRKTEPSFSILRATKKLRRVSPALVSLLLSRKRQVTIDRCDALADLLGLVYSERQYFRDWVARTLGHQRDQSPTPAKPISTPGRRKQVSPHLLTDAINVYVKDAFQLSRVRENFVEIYRVLGRAASQARIDRAIKFLLAAGYLRRTETGSIVPDTPLTSISQKIPNQKVRQFHKYALNLAARAVATVPPTRRYANTLVMPLNSEKYQELIGIIDEFAERIQTFAEDLNDGDSLYQLIINLSPTGGFENE
jgi:uncharacterized protein (TIGR02147 family)